MISVRNVLLLVRHLESPKNIVDSLDGLEEDDGINSSSREQAESGQNDSLSSPRRLFQMWSFALSVHGPAGRRSHAPT